MNFKRGVQPDKALQLGKYKIENETILFTNCYFHGTGIETRSTKFHNIITKIKQTMNVSS